MSKVHRYTWMSNAWLLMLLLSSVSVFAQPTYKLIVLSVDKDTAFIQRELHLKENFLRKEMAVEYVQQLVPMLRTKGFLTASADSVIVSDSEAIVHLFVGRQYAWSSVGITDEQKQWAQLAGIPIDQFDSAITINEWTQTQEKFLQYFENNGYPFAIVGFDSLAIHDDTIRAKLMLDRGRLYKFDSIRVRGPARISQNFIQRYLGIENGSLYRKQSLENINQRLLELPYLEQIQPWDLTMLGTGSLINLYLQPKRSNQVNVLAGFLPSNQQVGGKLLLTVDANLQLQNAFSAGEKVSVIWQQLQPKSPRINLAYAQPYLFKSSFGVDFAFELYKRDSSFLNVNGQLGILYMLSAAKTAKVVLQSQSTNVLDVDTNYVKLYRTLPVVADIRSLNIGVEYEVITTNYRFNPRSGTEFSLYGSVGNKTIRKNSAITQLKDGGFDYNHLYDSVKLQSYQLRLRATATKFFPIGKQSTIKTGMQAGWFQTPDPFRNELFQLGGYRLLRGFDEQSIFVNSYVVGTVEYRYLLGLNSNFFSFFDVGCANSEIAKTSNTYIGAGIGLSLETKGGIFNISFAAGKRNDLNFDIRQSKIHFGYVSLF
jgi:outer membrane protein assembly factor BamA